MIVLKQLSVKFACFMLLLLKFWVTICAVKKLFFKFHNLLPSLNHNVISFQFIGELIRSCSVNLPRPRLAACRSLFSAGAFQRDRTSVLKTSCPHPPVKRAAYTKARSTSVSTRKYLELQLPAAPVLVAKILRCFCMSSAFRFQFGFQFAAPEIVRS